MDDLISCEEWPVNGDKVIGVITLVREKPLNSLLLDTIDGIAEQFSAWESDDRVVCILMNSSTERAFCAGADITALYHSIKEADGGDNPYGEAFFTNEYKLDFAIHECAKPVIAWGDGIVMGGGLGLLGGCSHRVGTPRSRVAMPEITIGLFPDAGGTWLLSRMRSGLGYFMGLTGCQLSAADALVLDIFNHVVREDSKAEAFDGLKQLAWSGDASTDGEMLTDFLKQFETDAGDTNMLKHEKEISALISSCLAGNDFFTAFESGLDDLPEDEWVAGAIATYKNGSPTTARVFREQMIRSEGMTLGQTFEMEIVIACQCIRHDDFPEGVRALLIDKDRNPKWTHASVHDVPDTVVAEHFEPPWDTNPLAAS